MEELHKSEALKKVYAQMILNTAKEAAARVMASEKKALRLQEELSGQKEEALRLLLRLKQMFDAKMREAEMTSISQQRKIEELEAQLNEAEDVVEELRQELREVSAELENKTSNKSCISDERHMDQANAIVDEREINRLDTSGLPEYSLPVSQQVSIGISEMKNVVINNLYDRSNCCCKNNSQSDYCCVHNPDFASIITRRKEPNLYKNGCTQRVRAFEQNHCEEFPVSKPRDDIGDDETCRMEIGATRSLSTPILGADKVNGMDEAAPMLKEMKVKRSKLVKSFKSKRKGTTRNLKVRNQLHKDLYLLTEKLQQPSRLKRCMASSKPRPSYTLPSKSTEITSHSEPPTNNHAIAAPCDAGNKMDDNEVVTESMSTGEENNGSEEAMDITSKADCAETEDLLHSDTKASGLADKFLKYTFCRKRKKELASSSEDNSLVDKNNAKKKLAKKPMMHSTMAEDFAPETKASNDNQQLVQVAEQLVSLSGKH